MKKYTTILIILTLSTIVYTQTRTQAQPKFLSGLECSQIVNSIFEKDMRNELTHPLTKVQIDKLNHICLLPQVTETDIIEIIK